MVAEVSVAVMNWSSRLTRPPTISPTTAHFGWSSPMGRRCGSCRWHFGASPARRHGPAWLPKWGHRSSEHHPIGGLL